MFLSLYIASLDRKHDSAHVSAHYKPSFCRRSPLRRINLRKPLRRHTLMRSNVSLCRYLLFGFAPDCLQAPLLSPALATQPHSAHACTSHPAALKFRKHSAFASSRLSQALGSRKHSPSDSCAWICVKPIISDHLAASEKHNTHLGATSPLTPP